MTEELKPPVERLYAIIAELPDEERENVLRFAGNMLDQIGLYTRAPHPTGGSTRTVECPNCKHKFSI